MTQPDTPARRRRRRAARPAGPPQPPPDGVSRAASAPASEGGRAKDVQVEPEQAAESKARGRSSAARRPRAPARSQGSEAERGWRELAGSAPSQIGISGALRARDVARPRPEDEQRAEAELVIVRRQWTPPEDAGR